MNEMPLAEQLGHEGWYYKLPSYVRTVQDRQQWVVEECRDRSVVHVGYTDSGCPEKQGSASAWLHGRISEVATRVVGLDLDDAAVRQLGRSGVEGYAVDATNADSVRALGIGTFEVVLLGEVIEHVYNPVALLQATGQLCSSHGRVIITTPNAFSSAAVFAAARNRESVHPDHLHVFTPRTLVASALRAGLVPMKLLTYSSDTVGIAKAPPGSRKAAALQMANGAVRSLTSRMRYLQSGLILVCKPGSSESF